MTRRAHRWLEPTLLTAGAVCYAYWIYWRRAAALEGFVAYDFYAQFYPYYTQAWQALTGGGQGLLWTPYQDCGQPLLAIIHPGLLYPGHLVFGFFDRELAMMASAVLHLGLCGIGTFLLCRQIGLGRTAAFGAALAFELGWTLTNLVPWSPAHLATFAWLPVAMWRCEVLVHRTDVRRALSLAIVLALQLLPGFPEIGFYTYQLIALRIVWALLLRESRAPRALLGATAFAFLFPVFLDAAQFLPAAEVVLRSLRGGALGAHDLGPGFSWRLLGETVRSQIVARGNVLVATLAFLSLLAVVRRWRAAAFYFLTAGLYLWLSLGPGSLLFDLYSRLPFGSSFRGSGRLLWVVNFAVSILAGFGIEALRREPKHRRARGAAAVLLAVSLLVLHWFKRGPGWLELGLVVALLALATAQLSAATRRRAVLALPVLLFVNAMFISRPPASGFRHGDVYGQHAAVFAAVRERMSSQDRVLIVGGYPNLSLMPKSATLFRVPGIHNYETLAPRRYAEFFTYLRTGHPLTSMRDWNWSFRQMLLPELRRPLFDLSAARFLIVDHANDHAARVFSPPLRLLLDEGGVRVYENEQALPRARFVPRLAVQSPNAVLPSLAEGGVDPRRVAVVERVPSSGFVGADAEATGTATFLSDRAERLVLRVDASERGFLFLADQYFPGWTATVNGERREILLADHTFRAVEVPAGESEVVFAYRPWSVGIGAVLSAISLFLVPVLWLLGRSRSA